ncbi:MAG: GEVED domain-containing protein, partial [Actinomycetota bacterium]
WIDFNGDLDFDTGEYVTTTDIPDGTTNGTKTLTWGTVPSDIIAGTTYARFRISTDAIANIDVGGSKTNGEVEDYTLSITQSYDFGDAPDTYGTNLADGGEGVGASHSISLASNNALTNLRLGAAVTDAETDGQPTANAEGDDTSGTDDETGVASFTSMLASATSYSLTNVNATNNTGNPGNLRGWIDFDNSGTFDDDEVSGVTVVATGTTGVDQTLSWSSIPTDTKAQTAAKVRIRFTTDSLAAVTDDIGPKTNGEVEDYDDLTIIGTDFGDAANTYLTSKASGGASHQISANIKLGTVGPDSETDGQPTANADGDDSTAGIGIDDEDGVATFAS